MPAPLRVISQEFEAMAVANGDGSTTTLYATVVNAAGRFTVRSVNSGSTSAELRLMNSGGTATQQSFTAAAGSRGLITQAQSTTLGLTLDAFLRRVQFTGGARGA